MICDYFTASSLSTTLINGNKKASKSFISQSHCNSSCNNIVRDKRDLISDIITVQPCFSSVPYTVSWYVVCFA